MWRIVPAEAELDQGERRQVKNEVSLARIAMINSGKLIENTLFM